MAWALEVVPVDDRLQSFNLLQDSLRVSPCSRDFFVLPCADDKLQSIHQLVKHPELDADLAGTFSLIHRSTLSSDSAWSLQGPPDSEAFYTKRILGKRECLA
jgi:hypothetical protein